MSHAGILGDSHLSESVILQASETYERHYELKRRGHDLDRIVERVAEIHGMGPREILQPSKELGVLLCAQRATGACAVGVKKDVARGAAVGARQDVALEGS